MKDGHASVWLSDGRKMSALCDMYVGQQPTSLLEKKKGRDRQNSQRPDWSSHDDESGSLPTLAKRCLSLQCGMWWLVWSLVNIPLWLAQETDRRECLGGFETRLQLRG